MTLSPYEVPDLPYGSKLTFEKCKEWLRQFEYHGPLGNSFGRVTAPDCIEYASLNLDKLATTLYKGLKWK